MPSDLQTALRDLHAIVERLPGEPMIVPESWTRGSAEVALRSIAAIPLLQPYLGSHDITGHLDPGHVDGGSYRHIDAAISDLRGAGHTASNDLARAISAVHECLDLATAVLPSAYGLGDRRADAPDLHTWARFAYDRLAYVVPSVVTGIARPEMSMSLGQLADVTGVLAERLKAANGPSELTYVLPDGSMPIPPHMTAKDLTANQCYGLIVGSNGQNILHHRCQVIDPVVEINDLVKAPNSPPISRGWLGKPASSMQPRSRHAAGHQGVLRKHRVLISAAAALKVNGGSVEVVPGLVELEVTVPRLSPAVR